MENTPSVSVVMPIFNAEKYLKQALDSVVSQTLQSIEIICVNDGSTDSSLQILHDYANTDKRIVIIDKPNGGYGKAMNIGIDSAIGEYIGILEPDDYIKPTMYEKLYRAATEEDLDFIRSDYYRLTTDETGSEHLDRVRICNKAEYYRSVQNPQINPDTFNIHMENWTGIYKREWVKDNAIRFNESPGASFQDNSFWFETYCLAKRIRVYDEAFYCYRVDNAASSINQPNKVFTMLDEYQWIESWLKSKPELSAKFLGMLHYKKTHNCEFAFSRLAEEFQLPFLIRYADEYQRAFTNGEIDESLFWPDELQRLKEITNDPEGYLKSYRAGMDSGSQLEGARQHGNFALFMYYLKREGTASAFKRVLARVKRRR